MRATRRLGIGTRMGLVVLLAIGTLVAVSGTPHAGAVAGDRYRRWISPKTATCSTTLGGVRVAIDNQNVEFNNLPADAQFTIQYILNGVPTVDGPYPVEQTSGTKNYGAFAQDAPSYPFTFTFRLTTIIDGDTVYQSDLVLDCAADGSSSVSAVNTVLGPQYRRWISPKTKTCSTTATGVQVAIDNQDVEFNNLPSDAQFTLEYILNGVPLVDGPFTVEQTSGTKSYGPFAQPAPSYPFTFTFRMTTIVDGETVYTSDLVLDCAADGSSSVDAVNAVVTPVTPVEPPVTPLEPPTSPAQPIAVAPRFTG